MLSNSPWFLFFPPSFMCLFAFIFYTPLICVKKRNSSSFELGVLFGIVRRFKKENKMYKKTQFWVFFIIFWGCVSSFVHRIFWCSFYIHRKKKTQRERFSSKKTLSFVMITKTSQNDLFSWHCGRLIHITIHCQTRSTSWYERFSMFFSLSHIIFNARRLLKWMSERFYFYAVLSWFSDFYLIMQSWW